MVASSTDAGFFSSLAGAGVSSFAVSPKSFLSIATASGDAHSFSAIIQTFSPSCFLASGFVSVGVAGVVGVSGASALISISVDIVGGGKGSKSERLNRELQTLSRSELGDHVPSG